MRSRRSVLETFIAGLVEPVDPSMGALSRDTHCFGHMGNRLSLVDPFNEKTGTMNSETGITVRHEDLLVCEAATPQCPEVFTISEICH